MSNNTLLASDNFASGSLAAGWSAIPGGSGDTSSIVGGSPYVAEPHATSSTDGQIWTGISWPLDQISEVTVNAFTAGTTTQFNLAVRWQAAGASFNGYDVALGTGSTTEYLIQKFVAGSSTTLATGSVTVAAGDIWTFSAVGPFLTLYRNGALVKQIADTSYLSWAENGSPGFYSYSSIAVANVQISAWRGYNAQQPDGVWTKQGAIMPAIAGDFANGVAGIATCSQVLYEGNAQLLSGTVYKMWFAQQPTTLVSDIGNVYYAESYTGLPGSWTRSASPVLSGYIGPTIWKYNGTYYLYAQPNTGPGTAAFALYTSSNGYSGWTLQSSSVLAPNSSGWENNSLWQFGVQAIIGGTWYALYSCINPSGVFQTGLATAPDGMTFTKYSGNPVITMGIQQAFWTPDNSTFYIWGGEGQTGRGSPDYNPVNGVRYKVTNNFTTWSDRTPGIQPTAQYEGVNDVDYQSWPNAIIQVGNQVYAYTTFGCDGAQPIKYQIGLEIATANLADLVQFSENGLLQTASDNFGGTLSNWTTQGTYNGCQISGGVLEGTTLSANNGIVRNGTFSSSQYSSITIGTLASGGSSITPIVRGNTSNSNCYFTNLAEGSPSTVAIKSFVSGTGTQLGPSASVTPNSNDVWTLSVFNGSDGFPVLTLYQNGQVILQVQDYSNSITSGSPGIYIYPVTSLGNATISAWAGGNANVLPSYTPGDIYPIYPGDPLIYPNQSEEIYPGSGIVYP